MAIVALTKAQRDLIAAYLAGDLPLQTEEVEIIAQLQRNGLGVFHFSELAGFHADILILSMTYGAADQPGRVSGQIEELNCPEGEALLSLLMSRPAKTLIAVNSIPGAQVEKFSNEFHNRGTFLLGNYLKYIEALQHSDSAMQQRVIQQLKEHFSSEEPERPSSPFVRELAMALQFHFAAGQIHPEMREAHLSLPLKIDPSGEGGLPVVLLPDGYFARSPHTDYAWEFRQWENYADLCYEVLPTWSVNWWKNAQLESRKLAEQIRDRWRQKQ